MEQIQPIKDSVSMRNLSFNSSNNSFNNSNMISGSNNTVNEIEELDLSFDNFNNYLNDLSINNASIVGSVRTLYSLDDVNNVQQDKAQNFAITDMGTDNEVYWYSYQTYSNSRCVNTNVIAYKGDDVVYSAVLLGGGEGQSFDVVRTNNGYTIYSGSMAVADDSATGRSFGIYKYNIKDSDLGTNEVNFIDVSNSGVNICEAIGKSDDKRGWSEISFDSKNNVVAVHLHQEVYLYRIDNDTPFESFDFSSENAFSHFYLPSLGSRQGGAVSNNKYYYLYGNKGDCRIACVDFSDPNNVKYVFGDDVDSNYVALEEQNYKDASGGNGVYRMLSDLYKNSTGNDINMDKAEPEGIKVYNENGVDTLYIGFRVKDENEDLHNSIIVKINPNE